LVTLCVTSAVILSLVSAVVLALLPAPALERWGGELMGPWLLVIPVVVVLQSVQQVLRLWDNRHRQYPRMAQNGVLQSASNSAVSLLAGFWRVLPDGLILGTVVAQTAATAAYVKALWRDRAVFAANRSWSALKSAAVRYRSFAAYGAPALIASRLAQQSLVVLVGAYLGPAALGHVFLIQRVIGLPSTLIGNAFGDVFYENVSRAPKGVAFSKIAYFIARMLLAGVVIYTAIGVFLRYAFVPIFGGEWQDAVAFVPALTLVAFCSFVFAPVSVLFDYFEAQRLNLLWQIGWLVSNVAVFVVCNSFGLSAAQTVLVYGLKQAVWYAVGLSAFVVIARRRRAGPALVHEQR
jgi:O-antigen/teichoic acid export membrane protein